MIGGWASLSVVLFWCATAGCRAIVTYPNDATVAANEPLSDNVSQLDNNKSNKAKYISSFKPGFTMTSRGLSASYRNDRRQMAVNMLAHRMGAGTGTVDMGKPSGAPPTVTPSSSEPMGSPDPAAVQSAVRPSGQRNGRLRPGVRMRGVGYKRRLATNRKHQLATLQATGISTLQPHSKTNKAGVVRQSSGRGQDRFTHVAHSSVLAAPPIAQTPQLGGKQRRRPSPPIHYHSPIEQPDTKPASLQPGLLPNNFNLDDTRFAHSFIQEMHPHEKAILYEHARRGLPLPPRNLIGPIYQHVFNNGQPFPEYPYAQSYHSPYIHLQPNQQTPLRFLNPLPTVMAQTSRSNSEFIRPKSNGRYTGNNQNGLRDVNVFPDIKPNMDASSHNGKYVYRLNLPDEVKRMASVEQERQPRVTRQRNARGRRTKRPRSKGFKRTHSGRINASKS